MQLIQKFAAQRAAFEAAYASDDWSPLQAYLHPDITYEVMNMPFHCCLHGRDNVIAGLRRSVERFDRLCTRTVGIGSIVRQEGNSVLVHAGLRFEREGAPATSAKLWEIATYRDGLIERILDIYDPGCAEAFDQWMAKWGEGLDPSYADSARGAAAVSALAQQPGPIA